MNKTDLFLKRIRETSEKEVPEHVIRRIRLAFLDYIGVTMAGRRFLAGKAEHMADSMSGGQVMPLGMETGMSAACAAFVNGLNAHAMDFDDGTNAGIIHLGSPVFSALLAMAQKHPVDEETFMKAALMGYEAEFTMAMTIQPAAKKHGYHATGVCGVLGAAVALAFMHGFDDSMLKNVFSIAAVSAGGSLKVLEDGSELKPYNVAKTAMMAVTAFEMARAGFRTPDDVLSGNAGFICQMCGEDRSEMALPLLGGTYAVEKAYIKPYAACRYCHPAIDIALELRSEPGLKAEDIREVSIDTYELAVKKHDHTDIRGAGSAKMSIPYNFAVTLLSGKTGIEAFSDDLLSSSDVKELTKKIKVNSDREMTEAFPALTIAEVTVTACDGTVWKGRSDLPKGEPENPLSEDEARAKFMELMRYAGEDDGLAARTADAVISGEDPLKIMSML